MSKPMSAVVRSAAQLSPTEQDRTSQDRTTVPALANEIGLRAADRIDELALIGYPALDPATRAVYETAIRLAAEKVLDA